MHVEIERVASGVGPDTVISKSSSGVIILQVSFLWNLQLDAFHFFSTLFMQLRKRFFLCSFPPWTKAYRYELMRFLSIFILFLLIRFRGRVDDPVARLRKPVLKRWWILSLRWYPFIVVFATSCLVMWTVCLRLFLSQILFQMSR